MANYKPKPRKMEKFCVGCEQMKPRHEFYELPRGGLSKYCQSCHKLGMARYHSIKYRGDKEGFPYLSHAEFRSWLDKQPRVCYYCGISLVDTGLEPNSLTIDRLVPHFGYEEDNMVVACWRCNKVKGEVFTEEEMKKIVKEFDFAHRPVENGYLHTLS